jgi:tripartite-type tricarboxylate transporter receptor subunit TctC
VLLATLLASGFALADGLPTSACATLSGKTVRWLVPSKPGGGYDAYSRLIQPFLEARLNARIRVENRPEAGGIVAALTIRDARADGTVIGIVNAPGLLAAKVVGNDRAPDVSSDFTILGRVMGIQYLVLAGRDSGISNIGELLAIARQRTVLIGVSDSGSTSFFTVPVITSLLGVEHALVTGYVGNSARSLAVMRGEVDIVVLNYDSNSNRLDNGELIPLLQVTGEPVRHIGPIPSLSDIASRQAALTHRTPEQARQEADLLNQIVSTGRLVVAPLGLPEPLEACLGDAMLEVLGSDGLRRAAESARLSLAPLDRTSAEKNIDMAVGEIHRFEPLLRKALEQVRQ